MTSFALAVACSALRADDAVQPATAVAPVAPGPAVEFTATETRVGDRVVQRVGMAFDLTTRIIQSGQIANESSNQLRRQQQRTIDVVEVADGRAVKARASFEVSRRQTPENKNPNELAPLPIEGKSYLMVRNEDELTVTDAEGVIPPLEEYKLVAESLDSVGKPNPLAQVLAGRRVAVGERLLVPREVAGTILGLNAPEFAEVHRFELTLARLAAAADGEPELAVFQAAIEVRPEAEDAMAMRLSGEIAVEPQTCRLAAVDLAGPVQVTAIERTSLGFYQTSMSGELRLAIRSQFGTAK